MTRRHGVALVGLILTSLFFPRESHAEPSREDVEKAWIGTWIGDWQTKDGAAGGKVKLVIHSNKNGATAAVITFVSGSPAFGTEPFVPRVSQAPSPDSLTFSGQRNQASFTLALQLMANGIELKTNNSLMDLFPDNLKALLVKQ